MKHITLPALSILFACALPGTAASTHLETFSNDSSDEGWFQVSDGTAPTLLQNPATDRLDFAATSASLFYIAADATSSGAAFVGDYTSAGISQFTFDLTLASGSAVTELFFEIANLTEGETWQYSLTLPAFGTDTAFTVPLGSGTWTQTAGNENFAFILSQTETVGILLSSSTPGDLAGSIDNIAAVPEPSSITLVGCAALFAATRRRRSGSK